MSAWFLDGRLVSLILWLMVAEAALLLALHRWTGRGPAPVDLLINLASGMCLLLALRAALLASWQGIALSLTTALVCHVADLRRRWQSARPAAGTIRRTSPELP